MIVRTDYREGQLLRAEDLRDAQSHLRRLRQRHQRTAHGWGIVDGLQLTNIIREIEKVGPTGQRMAGSEEAQDTVNLRVSPGLAIDGFGRELVVAQPIELCLRVKFWELFADIWLLYREQPSEASGPAAGLPPGLATRISETAIVRYTKVESPMAIFEQWVSDDVLALDPFERGIDFQEADPLPLWPIFLGRLRLYDVEQIPFYTHRFSGIKIPGLVADPPHPPYATLIAERVQAPSQTAAMEIAPDRYSIELAASGTAERIQRWRLVQKRKLRDTNLPNKHLQIVGDVAVEQGQTLALKQGVKPEDCRLPTRALYLGPNPDPVNDQEDSQESRQDVTYWGIDFVGTAPPGKLAAPWRLYQVTPPPDDESAEAKVQPPTALRLEIGSPEATIDPQRQSFAVGSFFTLPENETSPASEQPADKAKKKFKPPFALKVRADDTVEIGGNLTVTGQAVMAPITANPEDPRFRMALLAEEAKGKATAIRALRNQLIEIAVEFENANTAPIVTITNLSIDDVVLETLSGSYLTGKFGAEGTVEHKALKDAAGNATHVRHYANPIPLPKGVPVTLNDDPNFNPYSAMNPNTHEYFVTSGVATTRRVGEVLIGRTVLRHPNAPNET